VNLFWRSVFGPQVALSAGQYGATGRILNFLCIGVPVLVYFGFGSMCLNFHFHFCLSFDLHVHFHNFYCKLYHFLSIYTQVNTVYCITFWAACFTIIFPSSGPHYYLLQCLLDVITLIMSCWLNLITGAYIHVVVLT
jgi:hypothetical protein